MQFGTSWQSTQLGIEMQTMTQIYHLSIVQVRFTLIGCCDLITQCILVRINHCAYHAFYSATKSSKIYRCWIMWGNNIRVVIIPSFLAIISIGQSVYLHLISRF